MSDFSATPITPESPERLRDCLSALARHAGAHVLRVEVAVAPSTTPEAKGQTTLVLTVTHSLGPEHEQKIGPLVAKAFFQCMKGLSKGVTVSEGE